MRLIDADALIKQLTEVVQRANKNAAYTGNRSAELTWDIAVKYIKNAPTVELEQKKGKWYLRGITQYDVLPYICTVCGKEANYVYDFCPNCGAKMDEAMSAKEG